MRGPPKLAAHDCTLSHPPVLATHRDDARRVAVVPGARRRLRRSLLRATAQLRRGFPVAICSAHACAGADSTGRSEASRRESRDDLQLCGACPGPFERDLRRGSSGPQETTLPIRACRERESASLEYL